MCFLTYLHWFNVLPCLGMLLRYFVNLYDMEIIEEESFLAWKEDVNDEYHGKGKALFQVNLPSPAVHTELCLQ